MKLFFFFVGRRVDDIFRISKELLLVIVLLAMQTSEPLSRHYPPILQPLVPEKNDIFSATIDRCGVPPAML